MAKTVKLGEKSRTLILGSAAFKMMRDATGRGMVEFMEDLNIGRIEVVSDVIYYGLRLGERYNKVAEPEEYTPLDVAMWIDEAEGVEAYLLMITDALPKPAAGEGVEEPGEGKQIGTGTS